MFPGFIFGPRPLPLTFIGILGIVLSGSIIAPVCSPHISLIGVLAIVLLGFALAPTFPLHLSLIGEPGACFPDSL